MVKPAFHIDLAPLTSTVTGLARTVTRSPPNPSPRVSPWPGHFTSPGISVAPEAVDYFQQATGGETSTRALTSLALVAGGRVMVALGVAGVSTAFEHGTTRHYVLGGLGVGAGLLVAAVGIGRSHRDTSHLNVRRAHVSAAASIVGALLVAGGGVMVAAGQASGQVAVVYEALPLRALGNFFVLGAIPNAFSSAEIVHGDVPIPHRVATRDLTMALAGAFLMTWAHLSAPNPPAPLWARELSQCGGIVCLALSGALARTDMSRAQAKARIALQARRRSSVAVML